MTARPKKRRQHTKDATVERLARGRRVDPAVFSRPFPALKPKVPFTLELDGYTNPYVDGQKSLYLKLGRSTVSPGYEALAAVHDEALDQAQAGKGIERHSKKGEAFPDQQIVQLGEWMGSTSFAVGQACKKALESTRLPYDRARAELLGAINYLSAAVIQLDRANRVFKSEDVRPSRYGGDTYQATLAPDSKAGAK